jgi:hypothetical protein
MYEQYWRGPCKWLEDRLSGHGDKKRKEKKAAASEK